MHLIDQRLPADFCESDCQIFSKQIHQGFCANHYLVVNCEARTSFCLGAAGYTSRNRLTRSSSMDSLKSSDSNDSMARLKCDPDGEWKVIASLQVRDTGTSHCWKQIWICFYAPFFNEKSRQICTAAMVFSLVLDMDCYFSKRKATLCVADSEVILNCHKQLCLVR